MTRAGRIAAVIGRRGRVLSSRSQATLEGGPELAALARLDDAVRVKASKEAVLAAGGAVASAARAASEAASLAACEALAVAHAASSASPAASTATSTASRWAVARMVSRSASRQVLSASSTVGSPCWPIGADFPLLCCSLARTRERAPLAAVSRALPASRAPGLPACSLAGAARFATKLRAGTAPGYRGLCLGGDILDPDRCQ
jgi:hypothetical protein